MVELVSCKECKKEECSNWDYEYNRCKKKWERLQTENLNVDFDLWSDNKW